MLFATVKGKASILALICLILKLILFFIAIMNEYL